MSDPSPDTPNVCPTDYDAAEALRNERIAHPVSEPEGS